MKGVCIAVSFISEHLKKLAPKGVLPYGCAFNCWREYQQVSR